MAASNFISILIAYLGYGTLFPLLILTSLIHKSSYSLKLLLRNISYLTLTPQIHVVIISNALAATVYLINLILSDSHCDP